ncbi:hypothetical protein PRIPAC_78934 [Pristionchus pacificus]|uniref:Uncharacterized protein n=1 Tax=Pristionchus pacificus TaxID=54126 RepID=A0A2A6C475_PRIPA|nr:hypothetical protein PRIPAC_78934 [Pristionchus pacificus]|eukprot:PDM72930.1 hypothetical protein PRIPAC_39364 [Pristionchus pacificus]
MDSISASPELGQGWYRDNWFNSVDITLRSGGSPHSPHLVREPLCGFPSLGVGPMSTMATAAAAKHAGGDYKPNADEEFKVYSFSIRLAVSRVYEAIARASVKYVMALAMRTEDIELEKELLEWMKIALQNVKCTKIIDGIQFMEHTPRGLCAAAEYRNPSIIDPENTLALADLNLFFDLGFLMSIYGSEFHDTTVKFTLEAQLERNGRPVESPRFASIVQSHYTRLNSPPTPYAHLLEALTRGNTVEVCPTNLIFDPSGRTSGCASVGNVIGEEDYCYEKLQSSPKHHCMKFIMLKFSWQHYVFLFILAAVSFLGIIYFHHSTRRTYPVKQKTAVCVSDEDSPFFFPCKDGQRHNEKLMKNILDSASSLSDEAIARASVKYVMALAMRTEDIELEKELLEWMKIALQNVKCTKIIDGIQFMEHTPRGLCAAAEYRNPSIIDPENTLALADLNLFFDLGFLMSIYGSEFHDTTVKFTLEAQLERNGRPVESPRFASIVQSHYTRLNSPPTPYAHLLDTLATRRNTVEEERVGVHLLAMVLEKIIYVMRSCNPPPNITWNEYLSRAAFKSNSYEGKNECRWTIDGHSIWDMIKLFFYDLNFNYKFMIGKL